MEILRWKARINVNLRELEELNGLITILMYELYAIQQDHRKSVRMLQEKRNSLLAERKNLSEDDLNALLSELETRDKFLKDSYNSTYLSLLGQIKVGI